MHVGLQRAYTLVEQAAALVSDQSVVAHTALGKLPKRPQDGPSEAGVRAARIAYNLEHIADSLHMVMTELDEVIVEVLVT